MPHACHRFFELLPNPHVWLPSGEVQNPLRLPRKTTLERSKVVGTCGAFRHAADTAPLEGLPILRCAIYDPLEGLQISKMRLAEMGV